MQSEGKENKNNKDQKIKNKKSNFENDLFIKVLSRNHQGIK